VVIQQIRTSHVSRQNVIRDIIKSSLFRFVFVDVEGVGDLGCEDSLAHARDGVYGGVQAFELGFE
jgi:hypothetical protein